MARTQHFPWRRHTGQVWAALWLLVFAALAPTITHALWASHSGPALSICSSAGVTLVSDGNAQPEEESAMPCVHCLFCLQPTDRGSPPPQPLPYHLMVQGGIQVPVVWQAFFYLLNSAWAPPPRGPPVA
jgi:hypothetical protein